MFPRSATRPPVAGDVARTAERMDEAVTAARREDWGAALGIWLKIAHAGAACDVAAAVMWRHRATVFVDADGQPLLGAARHQVGVARDPVTALALLTRARNARNQFPDHVYRAARDGTADDCAEAERPARLPLGGVAEGS
jgi:hypothetical protein